ncbi:NrdC-like thioredoxin [Aeromonas phage GomatiRiver_11]|nr:hypothetical protein OBDJBBDK_00121 [Aeromonas phage AhFM11]WKW84297.1 NrdC-like thioredoxin [Aeromonas phage GomatiRiver_11]
MNIEKHIIAQKQMREAEWSVRTTKHAHMRHLRGAYFTEKEADRAGNTMISEVEMCKAITDYLKNGEYDVLLARRAEVSKQGFRCPCCDTNQIQLVSWVHKVVDLRCRKCKKKFIWESPI